MGGNDGKKIKTSIFELLATPFFCFPAYHVILAYLDDAILPSKFGNKVWAQNICRHHL